MGLSRWTRRVGEIDALVRPIATGPVAGAPRDPLAHLGLRVEVETMLREIIAAYRAGDDAERAAIRQLFAEHRHFAWSATLLDATLRDQLTLFVIDDHGLDTRDAIMGLDALCEAARTANIDPRPLLGEAAAMASDVDKYGMGSIRTLLQSRVKR
jgi:hypothetical protein